MEVSYEKMVTLRVMKNAPFLKLDTYQRLQCKIFLSMEQSISDHTFCNVALPSTMTLSLENHCDKTENHWRIPLLSVNDAGDW